jgi:CRP/FNR family transcriptional regulator, anaerobic regulatory protein
MLSEILHQNKLQLENRTSYMLPYLDEITGHVEKLIDIAGPDFWEALKRRELRKDVFLLLEGDIDRHVWILEKGIVRVYACKDGHEITQYFFWPGEVIDTFGSSAPQTPSFVYIQAIRDSVVYAINRNTLKRLMVTYPELLVIEKLMLLGQANWLNQRLQRMQYLGATEQYEYMLRTQAPIVRLISINHIASYLGISPDTVTRIRKKH